MAKNGRLPKETAVYDSVMLPPFQQRPTLRCQLMRDKKQTNFGPSKPAQRLVCKVRVRFGEVFL